MTKDIDFQASVNNNVEEVVDIIKEICSIRMEAEDGMVFDTTGVRGIKIMEDADYQGVRVQFKGYLKKAYVGLQIDISFANVLTPKEISIEYPTLLNMPDFRLMSYNPETAIAEKLQAMIFLGSFNDRMKDFYDIYLLSQARNFDGLVLEKAITTTFNNRRTEIPHETPVPLRDSFSALKKASWHQFIKRASIQGDEVIDFHEIIAPLRTFLLPPLQAAAVGELFLMDWKAGKAWKQK